MCVHKYAQFHFNITFASVGGRCEGGSTLVVINHSITHLSEFRQVGEREGQWGGRRDGAKEREGERKRMEECSGGKEELNDREKE